MIMLLFIMSCAVGSNTNKQKYEINIKNEQVESKNFEVINDRKLAIKYYEKKMGYLHRDNNGNLNSFPVGYDDNITDVDLKYLILFPELGAIHLYGKGITDNSFQYFQGLKNLRSISLNETSVTGSGFRYLVDKTELYRFDLSKSPITDEGLKYLSEIKFKNPVNELYLCESKVTDAGMPYIAKMKFDQGRISLSGTAVTDEGIKHLAGFKNMIEIILYNTKVTDKGGKWLEAQLPDTTVYWGKRKPVYDER